MADEIAVLAGGCFWCTEAVFLDVVGSEIGRKRLHRGPRSQPELQAGLRWRYGPRRGDPDHFRRRAAQLRRPARHFLRDPRPDTAQSPGQRRWNAISLLDLPAERNQERSAREAIARANVTRHGSVVTTIEPMGDWWPAEDYHQDYWAGEGQRNPYCIATIPAQTPKAPEELPGACQIGNSAGLTIQFRSKTLGRSIIACKAIGLTGEGAASAVPFS